MAKVSASLENKSKDDLTLETKGISTLTLADAPWSLAEAEGTLAAYKISMTLESKTKDDLTLETK